MRKLQRELETDVTNIRLMIFDVDGVLTDNRMIYVGDHQEAKCFSAADGFAIKAVNSLGEKAPLQFAVITARNSELTLRRCRELGITEIHQKWDKLKVLGELLTKFGVAAPQVAFVGNDIPDIPVMEKVGLAVCPSDAEPEVLPFSHYQTSREGGRGCCREAIDFVLKAQGFDLLQIYRDGLANGENVRP